MEEESYTVLYIDASYTCQCPAVDMAERGFDAVLAIATEPAPTLAGIN
jgi:hypothetical protein